MTEIELITSISVCVCARFSESLHLVPEFPKLRSGSRLLDIIVDDGIY